MPGPPNRPRSLHATAGSMQAEREHKDGSLAATDGQDEDCAETDLNGAQERVETVLTLAANARFAAVTALDRDHKPLATTPTIAL